MVAPAAIRPLFRATSTAVRRVRAYLSGTPYEAAGNGRRMLGFRAPSVSPNTAILGDLTKLRDRSRTVVRNNGIAKGAVDKLVTNIIGTGIKPMSKAADPVFRQAVQALWLKWTDESDADGLLDFYGQQAQAVRAWLEGGEVFVRVRPRLPVDGLSVPLQLQVIEPELCPHNYNALLPNGNRVRAGIEFNPIGKRAAYWFYTQRAGDLLDMDTSQLVRVPAESVIHFYDPLRPGQLRGVPALTQAIVKLHELDKYDDAVLLRQQLANLFAAFLKRTGAGAASDVHPLTGQPFDKDANERPMLLLEPGIFQELDTGEEVQFSNPPGAGSDYKDFMRQQLFAIAASVGVPYEALTGDMSGVNDRTVRMVFNEFRMRIGTIQHHLVAFRLCRAVWTAWMYRAFLSGALPIGVDFLTDANKYAAVKWTPPRTPYIHPVQDVDSQERAVLAGFTSRSAVVSELGEDVEAIDEEQAADNARADEHGLRYKSDSRFASAGAKPAAANPNPDEAPGDEGQAGAAAA